MPKMSFDSSNAAKKFDTFPKLKLKMGEKARIVCIEDPDVGYVHTLRKPFLDKGKPVWETRNKKNGDEYKVMKTEFVSNPICLGDFGTLEERGSDPKNCPACAAATQNADILGPKRRFAMHVIKYKTKPGTAEVSTPFSVEVVVWGFTDHVFNKLIEIRTEQGDLRDRDLVLGPCQDETFQKFDFIPSGRAEWQASPTRKAQVMETYENNQAEDLQTHLGRKVARKFMEEDVENVLEGYRIANGEVVAPAVDLGARIELTSGLAGLLDDPATVDDSVPLETDDEELDFDKLELDIKNI